MDIREDKTKRLLARLVTFVNGFRFAGRGLEQAAPSERELRHLILQSPLFDAEYYCATNLDIADSGLDPAIHYLRYGFQGRHPSSEFDARYYLDSNPDVREAKLNPLVHYLLFGRREGRKIRPLIAEAPRPKAPDRRCWDELASLLSADRVAQPTVDIIVPVYRGFDETANCIHTVLRSRLSAPIPCEVVVVDDASPDTQLSQLLAELAQRGLITLLRNQSNKGFVASVNRAMSLHDGRDVILLNSDTEVFGDWVERLQRAAYSHHNVGTVTPFSNNATIFSYPHFCDDFVGEFEIAFEELDRLASEANAGKCVDVPTANGFCMYIRRECLREAGLFDAKTFGRGYGEENDFSRRIAALGWRNVLAGDVFVRHLGRVSFLNSSEDLKKRALQLLNQRYPGYEADIAAFIKKDPPRPLRRNLDVARLRRACPKRVFLFVLHDRGGGTLRHVHELCAKLDEEAIGSLLLQPNASDGNFGLLRYADLKHLSDATQIDIRHGLSGAVELLRAVGVVHIHVHHVMGFALELPEFVRALAERSKLNYDVTLHDYLLVCPRVEMIDGSGIYCDNYELEICEHCIKDYGSPFGDVSVWSWRMRHADFLAGARRVFVPDQDVEARIKKFFPSLAVTVRPHPEPMPQTFGQPILRQAGEDLRVAIIGAIGPHKGSRVLFECAKDAVHRRLPICFHIIGYTDEVGFNRLPNVEITGRYSDNHLPILLKRSRCHLAFFPAVWPETYSYTLSQAWFAGLYPVAFDLGAIARRIREIGWGHILPKQMMTQYAAINDALLACKVPPMPETTHFSPRQYDNIISDYYQLKLA